MMALHGFFGQPGDFAGMLPDKELLRPSWIQDFPKGKEALPQLAAHLNSTTRESVLLGYSMGGRIALHMLLDQPERYHAAIIASASPGMTTAEDKQARLENDQNWASRFLNDPWAEVVSDWNAQPVFAADPPDQLARSEKDFSRTDLANALRFGSVANQADLRDHLSKVDIPILWIAGEEDLKYTALAQECAELNSEFQSVIIPRAGHRVLWSNQPAFEQAVEQFLASLGTLTI